LRHNVRCAVLENARAERRVEELSARCRAMDDVATWAQCEATRAQELEAQVSALSQRIEEQASPWVATPSEPKALSHVT
jgi:outer membrane murein-binding lipoprotein Lpp